MQNHTSLRPTLYPLQLQMQLFKTLCVTILLEPAHIRKRPAHQTGSAALSMTEAVQVNRTTAAAAGRNVEFV